MDKIRIQPYKNGQEILVSDLIRKVYDEFVSIDYSDEGNQFFYNWIDPMKIAERQLDKVNLWVAFYDETMVGMIEAREDKYVSLLFVDKKFQGQGIAKQLFRTALAECLRRDPSLETFFVHASPYSIAIYKKMGFVETDEMQEQFGIKYLPMELDLNHLKTDFL